MRQKRQKCAKFLLSYVSCVVDCSRCLKLALVHDIGECIVGDLTPYCGVSPDEKHKREEEAIQHLETLAGEAGPTFTAYYHVNRNYIAAFLSI